jgi:phage tail P2-like protein
MKTLNDISLSDLLPESLQSEKKVSRCVEAIDPELRAVADNRHLPAVYAAIDTLNSVQLDHVAAQFDVSVWRDSWPVALKRSVAKTLASQKARMGTLSAIKSVLASLGAAVSIVEWWQTTPKGEPHTFTITASLGDIDGVLDAQQQEDFMALLDEAKPVRSHYELILAQSASGTVGLPTVARTLVLIECSNR